MSGGDVDVEPFLVSRNTLGNGEPTTQNLEQKCQNWVMMAEEGDGG